MSGPLLKQHCMSEVRVSQKSERLEGPPLYFTAVYGIINALRLLSRAVAERNLQFLSARCFWV